MSKPTSTTDMHTTTAHLIQTSGHELGHVAAHIAQAQKSKTKAAVKFNLEHAAKHVGGVQDHIQRVVDHIKGNYPAIGKQFDTLERMTPQSGGGLKGVMNKNGNMVGNNQPVGGGKLHRQGGK